MKKIETILATAGRSPEKHRGAVNTPVYRASTILFPNLAEFEAAENGTCPYPTYGRYGTPSTEALETAIAELEGADNAIVTASGLSAIITSLLAFLGSGDHVLIPDSVYGSTRRSAEHELKNLGITVEYYDPLVGAGIEKLMRANTKVVFVESPGSITFEMQDIPAIAKVAHVRGALVISDNTWATPLFIKPFELGVDISIHSASKYIGGHSDLIMGTISFKREHYKRLQQAFRNISARPSGDDCYLALRGLRTLAVRVREQYAAAVRVAKWLEGRNEVEKVIYPALASHPGHEIWKRDFSGASSLFSILLKNNYSHSQLAAMLDGLEHFGMGYSWGGYESLITPCKPQKIRTATKWEHEGFLLRLHIGLENTDDLIADLERGFKRLEVNM